VPIMTLTEMRYLVALSIERHFARAAERCHVSQPTLSVAIKKVEGELGTAIFERATNELRTTAIGEQIIQQAKRVLEENVRLEEIASQGKDALKGELRIGVIYTIAPYLLPQLVPALHRLAPNMPLYLKEDFTANLLPSLKSGELDIIVLALPIEVSGVVTKPLYEEVFRVIVPIDHPLKGAVAPRMLRPDQTLLLGQGNCFRDQVLEACPRLSQSSNNQSLEGGSLETMRYMVASGAGVAIMPASAADPLVSAESMVRVLPFSEPQPKRRVGMAWRVSFPRPKAVEVFESAVLECQLPGTNRSVKNT